MESRILVQERVNLGGQEFAHLVRREAGSLPVQPPARSSAASSSLSPPSKAKGTKASSSPSSPSKQKHSSSASSPSKPRSERAAAKGATSPVHPRSTYVHGRSVLPGEDDGSTGMAEASNGAFASAISLEDGVTYGTDDGIPVDEWRDGRGAVDGAGTANSTTPLASSPSKLRRGTERAGVAAAAVSPPEPSPYKMAEAAGAFVTPAVAASSAHAQSGARERPQTRCCCVPCSSSSAVSHAQGGAGGGHGGSSGGAEASLPAAAESETRSQTEIELEMVFPEGPSLEDLREALAAGMDRPLLTPGRAKAARGRSSRRK